MPKAELQVELARIKAKCPADFSRTKRKHRSEKLGRYRYNIEKAKEDIENWNEQIPALERQVEIDGLYAKAEKQLRMYESRQLDGTLSGGARVRLERDARRWEAQEHKDALDSVAEDIKSRIKSSTNSVVKSVLNPVKAGIKSTAKSRIKFATEDEDEEEY